MQLQDVHRTEVMSKQANWISVFQNFNITYVPSFPGWPTLQYYLSANPSMTFMQYDPCIPFLVCPLCPHLLFVFSCSSMFRVTSEMFFLVWPPSSCLYLACSFLQLRDWTYSSVSLVLQCNPERAKSENERSLPIPFSLRFQRPLQSPHTSEQWSTGHCMHCRLITRESGL